MATAELRTQKAPCAEGQSVLRAAGLRKSFGGQQILDDVSFDLRQGEVVLLRGENGSGKTTLINIVTGNLEPDSGEIEYAANGRSLVRQFPRRWWNDANPFDRFTPEYVANKGLGRTWQEVRLFGTASLTDNIAVASPNHPGENPLVALFAPIRSGRHEARLGREADATLNQLGLGGRGGSSADMVSLGQSKRVAIARAVAAGAKVILLDEPLAGLDRRGVADVLELLQTLVRDHGVTLVIVEHVFNQSYLAPLVTTDWYLERGRLTVTRGVSETRALKEAKPSAEARPAWVDLLAGGDAEISTAPLPRGALLTRIRRPELVSIPPVAALEVRELVVNRGSRAIVGMDDEGSATGFDLTLYQGEIAVLQAPNGWGKSTLLDCLVGAIRPKSGHIAMGGQDLKKASTSNRSRRGLTLVRSSDNVFNSLTTHEMFRLSPGGLSLEDAQTFPNRRISDLSGGQKQRLAVAAMRRREGSKVALFDEPFSMLDRAAIAEVARWLIPGPQSASLIALPMNFAL